MDRLVYWIWLSLSCTPGSRTFKKLLERYKNAEEVYGAEEYEIRKTVGSRSSDCSLLLNKDLKRAEDIYRFCTKKEVGIITYCDEAFPESLRTIPTPPVLLYYRGHLPDFNKTFRTTIVGTRYISDYGRRNAFFLGYDLACAECLIVSGMATGIDGVALAGALAAGGTTIAVLGSGIDVCYPPQHRRLAQEIVKKGCIFTEYAPGTKPYKCNFPRRNRIMSGLSPVTLVVEGRERGGSIITARHAKEQGRTVYAVPGNVGNVNSQVTNLLIKNGAKLCTSADDIVRDYEMVYPGLINPYKLQVNRTVNMNAALSEYKVVAVAPSDDIFKAPWSKKKSESKEVRGAVPERDEKPKVETFGFDAETLQLYKKIPADSDCTIESLVDEKYSLRTVMKLLLKLEMGKFIEMLPGERVKRNI